ncbi:MAG: DUF169 domain-containing protein [Moorellales bacterium]
MQTQIDLSVFRRFQFEHKLVAVKFAHTRPQDIPPFNKKVAFCEMLREAQVSDHPFYVSPENHDCLAALVALGISESNPIFEGGYVGPRLDVYEEPRANQRVYLHAPRMPRGVVRYVVFSGIEGLSFDPDLLIVTARPHQAEILLRATSYRTGAPWAARGSVVLGCSYLYVYPYLTGELNFLVTGLHHGMKARQLFPEGLLLMSIPYDKIPAIVDSLRTMKWDLPQYALGKEGHIRRVKEIVTAIEEEFSQEATNR